MACPPVYHVAVQGVLLPAELMDAIIEVRVEQAIDTPTSFAIQFQDDLCAGRLMRASHEALQPGRVVTVAGDHGGEVTGLVHGPIHSIHQTMAKGGQGSTIEVRGGDRQVDMSRVKRQRAWQGRASDAAFEILSSRYGISPIVENTPVIYGTSGPTLNQASSDFDFLQRIAELSNVSFWLDWECVLGGRSVNVVEYGHFRPSPSRTGGDREREPLGLVLNGRDPRDGTVTRLNIRQEHERPTSTKARTVENAEAVSGDVESTQPALDAGGRGVGSGERNAPMTRVPSPGPYAEVRVRAEAAITRAGWHVRAEGSTTGDRLQGILRPHQITTVAGVDPQHAGHYQVESVVHVITPSEHLMDFVLRRNVLMEI
ncbi:MAG: hypothetical protein OEY14_16250 [Myxococcales bacterium]|nr:hypothetical protein [Myxococcales bacterium]